MYLNLINLVLIFILLVLIIIYYSDDIVLFTIENFK